MALNGGGKSLLDIPLGLVGCLFCEGKKKFFVRGKCVCQGRFRGKVEDTGGRGGCGRGRGRDIYYDERNTLAEVAIILPSSLSRNTILLIL